MSNSIVLACSSFEIYELQLSPACNQNEFSSFSKFSTLGRVLPQFLSAFDFQWSHRPSHTGLLQILHLVAYHLQNMFRILNARQSYFPSNMHLNDKYCISIFHHIEGTYILLYTSRKS